MKKNSWTLILLLAFLNHACRLPELPQKLINRECNEIKGVIKLQQSASDPKSYTVSLDSLTEEVKALEWEIDNVVLKETSKSFSYNFSKLGEHDISVMVSNYCTKSAVIKKKLNICESLKGVISVEPIEAEKSFFIWVDSLKGNVRSVSWFVNGKKLINNNIDFGNNKKLTVTYAGTQELGMWSFFSDDGDYNLVAEVQDSCGNILQAKRTLSIKTTYVAIPDANFEQKLINLGIDNDKKINGRIWEGDALKVKELNIAGPSGPSMGTSKYYDGINIEEGIINSIQGVEAFKNLESLNVSRNRISTIPLRNLTKLKYLSCSYNPVSALDLKSNIELIELTCYTTNISSLDVSKNTSLQKLDCGNNYIAALDLEQNLNLKELYCDLNRLNTLNLVKNNELIKLDCYSNELQHLDLSKNTLLKNLICNWNKFTTLDLSNNTVLTLLNCQNNQLTILDISKISTLANLYCNYNPGLYNICVEDIQKAKLLETTKVINGTYAFEKDTQAEWVKCN